METIVIFFVLVLRLDFGKNQTDYKPINPDNNAQDTKKAASKAMLHQNQPMPRGLARPAPNSSLTNRS